MTMIPADVVTAHAEYSVWPRKYRLSNTFAGSACHVSRAGGPGGRGLAPRAGRDAGSVDDVASVQMRLKTPAKSAPAAAFAAATCASLDDDCVAIAIPAADRTATPTATACSRCLFMARRL